MEGRRSQSSVVLPWQLDSRSERQASRIWSCFRSLVILLWLSVFLSWIRLAIRFELPSLSVFHLNSVIYPAIWRVVDMVFLGFGFQSAVRKE